MTSVTDALHEFELANQADGLADKTLEWYRWLLRDSAHSAVPWLAERRVHDVKAVTTTDLREYVVWLRGRQHTRTQQPLSLDTVNDYLRSLHRFFAWAAEEYDFSNPMKRISYPRPRKQQYPRAVTMDDFRKMFASCKEDLQGIRNKAVLAFLLDTGVRAAGLCGLKLEDLNLNGQRAVVVEKGNKPRTVLFSRTTAELIEAWYRVREPEPSLFYNLYTREPLTTNGLRQLLERIGRRAKVTGRVNPHSFRHAFAREWLLAGGDIGMLAVLMGHSSRAITADFYAIFTQEEIFEKYEHFSPITRLFAA